MRLRRLMEGTLPRYAARAAAALATVAVLGVVLLAGAALLAPRLAGVQPTIVLSGSMEPALRTGGLAFVRTLPVTPSLEAGSPALEEPTARIRAGDIVTFRSTRNPQVHVSHRVIAVIDSADGRRFATRGDANAHPDPTLVPAANVIGTVVYHVPHLGRFAAWLREPRSFLILAGFPTALVILGESRTVVRDARSRRGPTRAELHRLLQELARR